MHAAPKAAYVHIPFCVKKCGYCDFVSYAGQPAEVQKSYVQAIRQEISLAAVLRAQPLETVFFGGGTPTVLDAGLLTFILGEIGDRFGIAPDAEITLEANPGTVSAAGLTACRQAGFNRISFGLQVIKAELLRVLGRIHDQQDFTAGVEMAVKVGFQSINADILFGVPGQTVDDVVEITNFLTKMPVDHISFYSLNLEEGTPLKAWCDENPDHLPDEDIERQQYWTIKTELEKSGFEHYEISNAARPGCRCRHNLVYWHALPYFGFGAAAHSYILGRRRANTPDLTRYIDIFTRVARLGDGSAGGLAGAFPAAAVLETVDEPAARKEMLFLGLRLLEGVRFDDFLKRFGVDMRVLFAGNIKRLVARGLLIEDSQGIRASRLGLDLANQIFMEFV